MEQATLLAQLLLAQLLLAQLQPGLLHWKHTLLKLACSVADQDAAAAVVIYGELWMQTPNSYAGKPAVFALCAVASSVGAECADNTVPAAAAAAAAAVDNEGANIE